MRHILFGAVGALIAFAATATILIADPTAQTGEHWVDPKTGEWIKILQSRPIPIPVGTMFEDRCMLIDLAAPPAISGTTPAKCYAAPQLGLPVLRGMERR